MPALLKTPRREYEWFPPPRAWASESTAVEDAAKVAVPGQGHWSPSTHQAPSVPWIRPYTCLQRLGKPKREKILGTGFQIQAGREGDTIRVGGLEIRKQCWAQACTMHRGSCWHLHSGCGWCWGVGALGKLTSSPGSGGLDRLCRGTCSHGDAWFCSLTKGDTGIDILLGNLPDTEIYR